MPLVGAVVLEMEMLKLHQETGPKIQARFKVTAYGKTDWVPIILGARAIDCPERGGLGFSPGPASHTLRGLGIQVERVDITECSTLECFHQMSMLGSR